MLKRVAALAALSLCIGLNGPSSAETLQDVIRLAYINNPDIEAQRRGAEIAQETLNQARGQRRPQVDLSGSAGFESIDSNRPFAGNVGERPLANAALQASVPVYTGGQISAGIRQAQAGLGAANAQLDGFNQDLILDVVVSYVDVLRDRETIAIRENSVALLTEQLRAAEDRFEVGVVTRTDVAQSEARLEGANAALAGAEAALQGSNAVFAFLIGYLPDDLAPVPPAPALPATFDDALALALNENPDLAALEFNQEATKEAVSVARGALRPSVSIVGTASHQETFDENFRDTEVTALAQATVPLFSGGILKSQVREAKLADAQAKLQIETTRRRIRAEVAQAWFNNLAAERSIDASERQVEAAEIAYEGAQAELQVGTRTTLDVLDQEQELLDARLGLINAERDAYVASHELLRAMGVLTLETLEIG
ncbi:MAG: TolC family outer membrane protein [Henriciella sp.]|nr:TolC family outer membrane protein [Henriciella sp.]